MPVIHIVYMKKGKTKRCISEDQLDDNGHNKVMFKNK